MNCFDSFDVAAASAVVAWGDAAAVAASFLVDRSASEDFEIYPFFEFSSETFCRPDFR